MLQDRLGQAGRGIQDGLLPAKHAVVDRIAPVLFVRALWEAVAQGNVFDWKTSMWLT